MTLIPLPSTGNPVQVGEVPAGKVGNGRVGNVTERNGSARDARNGLSTKEYDQELEAKIRARLQVVS